MPIVLCAPFVAWATPTTTIAATQPKPMTKSGPCLTDALNVVSSPYLASGAANAIAPTSAEPNTICGMRKSSAQSSTVTTFAHCATTIESMSTPIAAQAYCERDTGLVQVSSKCPAFSLARGAASSVAVTKPLTMENAISAEISNLSSPPE